MYNNSWKSRVAPETAANLTALTSTHHEIQRLEMNAMPYRNLPLVDLPSQFHGNLPGVVLTFEGLPGLRSGRYIGLCAESRALLIEPIDAHPEYQRFPYVIVSTTILR